MTEITIFPINSSPTLNEKLLQNNMKKLAQLTGGVAVSNKSSMIMKGTHFGVGYNPVVYVIHIHFVKVSDNINAWHSLELTCPICF